MPKRNGGVRLIRVPADELKAIQRKILDSILARLDRHPANHCRRGRSVISNARLHLHRRYTAAYDIRDAFPSTRPGMVTAALVECGCGVALAEAITSVSTVRRQLPQGAPTSTALLSIVLRPIDNAVSLEAQRHGLIYTRYVDDMFISGGRRPRTLEGFMNRALARMGFVLAKEKTRRWEPGSRPTLAGIVLGTAMAPTPECMRSTEALLRDFESGKQKLNDKDVASLKGRIAWIRAVARSAGDRLDARLNAAADPLRQT